MCDIDGDLFSIESIHVCPVTSEMKAFKVQLGQEDQFNVV
jgi:hypothetical protein